MVEVGETAVPQFDVLEGVPEVLDGVHLGRVAGVALELEAGSGAGAEELPDGAAACHFKHSLCDSLRKDEGILPFSICQPGQSFHHFEFCNDFR